MKQSIALTLLCALFCISGESSAIAADSEILGRYWLPDRDGQFEIYEKNDRFFGRVIAYNIPDQLDAENADPALRTRPFVGIDMFSHFRLDADVAQWVGGKIYDAKSGKTYDCYMWFEPHAPDTLVARGFIGFSLFGRNEQFERVRAE
jgi:uncharacterized protein (DUF2147 family)